MAATQDLIRCRVVPLSAAPSPLDYAVPPDMALYPGDLVRCPLGPRTIIGVVWDDTLAAAPVPDARLRPVAARFGAPPIPAATRRFVQWAAGYYLAPLPSVLRMVLPGGDLLETVSRRVWHRATQPGTLTARRQAVWDALGEADGSMAELARLAGCSPALIKGMAESGALVEAQAARDAPYPVPDPDYAAPVLSPEQAFAADALRLDARSSARTVPSLLDGVTGSGKTEVYFEAVAETLRSGRQALVLLPEIALTQPWLSRFAARFGCLPVVWHSGLSQPERRRAWQAIAGGAARVVVGARSALFLPYPELGLIVVDEEHETSFKQEDGICYQARDMAVVRGSLGKFPVLLASATPSIESHVNARTGRYRHVILPGRFLGTELPEIAAIDLRREPPDKGRWLAPSLVEAMVETMAKGQQSLLYLNRRGYAPLTLCRSCGHRIECPQCTAWLVEHRFRNRLHCHHCGFSLHLPETCPKCLEPGTLVACGPGIERVAEEIKERFPDAKVELLSSDLVPGLEEMRAVIKRIEKGEAHIIIGTQIVAKGHHFPDLATVGIVDGDLGLAQGADPRAGERTFQLLHQVTGRAGRSFARGRGFIQTHMPENPVMAAIISGDREAFLAREIEMRQRGMLPPYGRLAAIVISSRDKETAAIVARDIAHRAPASERIEVLGPAEAPIAVVRGRHRWRLLVKAPRDIDIQAYLRAWNDSLPKLPNDIRISLDVDPYNFL